MRDSKSCPNKYNVLRLNEIECVHGVGKPRKDGSKNSRKCGFWGMIREINLLSAHKKPTKQLMGILTTTAYTAKVRGHIACEKWGEEGETELILRAI